MDPIRLITLLMAIAVICANIKWWRRAANRHFAEQIIPPTLYAVLVIAFLILVKLEDLNVELLNGLSLGIRNISLIIFLIYVLTRKDHHGNDNR